MKLDPIFTSHAVFAAGQPVRIYGTGKGAAEITFAGVNVKVKSDSESWETELPAMEYGGPYELRFSSQEGEVILEDIFIGEVYLFSGQSNMQFRLCDSNTPSECYEDIPSLRIFRTYLGWENGEYVWEPAQAERVGNWSALAYLAGRHIAKEKNIAVGIITCHLGASVIESWVPEGTFEAAGIFLADEDKHGDHFYPDYAVWNKDGFLYNELLKKVIPFPVSGAAWYQGESDSSEAEGAVYCDELAALIEKWRELFRSGSFPFVAVQIADHDPRSDRGWKSIQEAQEMIPSKAENVKCVKCADICESDDIHPPTKDKLALRIAQALMELYK